MSSEEYQSNQNYFDSKKKGEEKRDVFIRIVSIPKRETNITGFDVLLLPKFLQVNNYNTPITIRLHQFQYFITTDLCMVEIYQQMFQSNSFNRNDLMVLFNCG